MPGLYLVFSRDPHTRKTARGATAAPRGKQPILVQTECALAVGIVPEKSSGSGDFRWEFTFPETPRSPADVRTTALSLSGNKTRDLQVRLEAGRSRSAAHGASLPGAPGRLTPEGTPSPPRRISSAAASGVG